jgi:hypothetical protein
MERLMSDTIEYVLEYKAEGSNRWVPFAYTADMVEAYVALGKNADSDPRTAHRVVKRVDTVTVELPPKETDDE